MQTLMGIYLTNTLITRQIAKQFLLKLKSYTLRILQIYFFFFLRKRKDPHRKIWGG